MYTRRFKQDNAYKQDTNKNPSSLHQGSGQVTVPPGKEKCFQWQEKAGYRSEHQSGRSDQTNDFFWRVRSQERKMDDVVSTYFPLPKCPGTHCVVSLTNQRCLELRETGKKGVGVVTDGPEVYFKRAENVLRSAMLTVAHFSQYTKTVFCGWMLQGVELGLSKAAGFKKELARRRERRAGGRSTREHRCWIILPSVGNSSTFTEG